ncbi:MAG: hypothetical protein IPM91_00875 [Bacteroidetes bacterium]|nr:hypothetical protein [Bacteroidota bacterium]
MTKQITTMYKKLKSEIKYLLMDDRSCKEICIRTVMAAKRRILQKKIIPGGKIILPIP